MTMTVDKFRGMRIYVASQYSHPDLKVREGRFRAVCMAAGRLLKAGHLVYSPIAHTHPIAMVCNLPTAWAFWKRLDKAAIEQHDVVAVLELPGWGDSHGIEAEVAYAQKQGKYIIFLEPTDAEIDAAEGKD